MEGRKAKRGRAKTTGGHARVAEKKKKTQVMNEKEEMDRLEAASVLSSLMFLPPKSSKDSNPSSPVHSEQNGVVSSTSTMTYISAAPSTGIPTRGPLQGPQSMARGSGIAKVTTAPAGRQATKPVVGVHNSVILAQLQNQVNYILKNGKAQPIQLMMPLQFQALSKKLQEKPAITKAFTTLPSVVKHAEPPKLPVTLNVGQTVNRDVATALRQAVTSTTKKQTVVPVSSYRGRPSTSARLDKAKATDSKSSRSSGNQLPSSIKYNDVANAAKKNESSDNNLPLKKRRLIVGNMSESEELGPKAEPNVMSQNITSTRLSDLTSAVQIENILQMAREYNGRKDQGVNVDSVISAASTNIQEQGEGYRPVQIDPRTSLMILSDVKVALTPDQDGDLPIHIAVVHENLELVKKLIDIMGMSGKSVDRYNKLQQTPLHLAILVNKPDIVAALLEAGANPNLVDRHGCTSIHIAVTKMFPDCLRTLFDHIPNRDMKLNLNTKNYDGYPALHTCVDLNDLSTLEFLVQRGANVDIQDGKAGRSAVFYATEYNRVKMVRFLVEHGANAEMNNYAGVSPLMVAQSGDMKELVGVLQRALDVQKVTDGEAQDSQTKKVPIPRIPSKSSLIVPDSAFRSRSNSEDRKSPAINTRTSSVSSCSSPIDLSIGKHLDLPKDPPKVKQERLDPVNNVKEKHTQLVAALEGKNVVERPQVADAEVVNVIPCSEATVMVHEKYIPVRSPEEIDLRVRKPKGDENQVTSSSDLRTETISKAVVNESDKMDTEVEPSASVETLVVSSGNYEEMEVGETVGKSDSLQQSELSKTEGKSDSLQKSEFSKTDLIISESKHPEPTSGLNSVDIEMSDGSLPSASGSISAGSPEMPVLSRMASFSNEQDSSSVSIVEDLPDIDKEASSEALLETGSGTRPKPPVNLETQRSQESLQSSLGFDTETVYNRKIESTDSEMDASQESSQKSDDSVEIENAALSIHTIEKDSKKMEIDKDIDESESAKDSASESLPSENLPSINVVPVEDSETDEEDEEHPLVIDEGPADTLHSKKENNDSVVVSKKSLIKEDSSSEKTNEPDPSLSSHKEQEKKGKPGTVDDTGSEKTADKKKESEHKTKVFESKKIAIGSSVEKANRIKDKDKSTSNGVKDSNDHAVSKERVHSASSLESEHSVKVSNNTNKDQPETVKDKNKDDEDSSVCKSKDGAVTDSAKKPDSATRDSSPLSSVDHLLKDGKAHTLFYHDGEGYKPLRIFIDNSEQSSLVLQKMLQANFSGAAANKVASASRPLTNSASTVKKSHSETSSNLENNKEVTEKQDSAVSKKQPVQSASDSGESKTTMQVRDSEKTKLPEENSVVIDDKTEEDSSSSSSDSDSSSGDKPVNPPDSTAVQSRKNTGGADKLPEGAAFRRGFPPSFQMAYIDSLKKKFEPVLAEVQKRIRLAGNIQSVSDKSISNSSDSNKESHTRKRQKVSNEKDYSSDKPSAAEKLPKFEASLSNSVVKTGDKILDTTNKARDTKIVEVNAAEKTIKLHIKQEVPAVPKSSVFPPGESCLPSLTSSLSASQIYGSSSHLPSQIVHRTFTPPPATVKVAGFQSRSSGAEGTLTRVNPDIKNRLSMALQSPQRKLGRPKAGLSCQEYESRLPYPNLQGLEGVTPQSVSETRQQL